jgi:DNA-binding response OmpR family regulator
VVEAAQDDTLRAGDLVVRPTDGLVMAGGRVLALSLTELRLLVVLLERRGTIISREDLYRLVWRARLRPKDRSVDVYVHKLRAKLEAALPEQRFIHTHFGFGYRLDPEPSRPSQDFHSRNTGT